MRVDRAKRRGPASVRDLLDALGTGQRRETKAEPTVLDAVALLADIPAVGLTRGQVGTVVEQLNGETVLVEFSDDDGRAYAIAPCPQSELLVLHYIPESA